MKKSEPWYHGYKIFLHLAKGSLLIAIIGAITTAAYHAATGEVENLWLGVGSLTCTIMFGALAQYCYSKYVNS